MTTITNPQIKTIVEFISAQMDGDQVPSGNSPEVDKLASAIRTLQAHPHSDEFRLLGIACLGLVIGRVHSNIQAERALHKFIQPGGDHA